MKIKVLKGFAGAGIEIGDELEAILFRDLPKKYQEMFNDYNEADFLGAVVVRSKYNGYYIYRTNEYERVNETLTLRFGNPIKTIPVITEHSELYVLGAFDVDTGIFKRFIRKGGNGNIAGYSSYESAKAGRNHGSEHASDEVVKIIRIDKMVVLEDEK